MVHSDELIGEERDSGGDRIQNCISTIFLLEELSKSTKNLSQTIRYSNRNSEGKIPNVT